MNGFVQTRLTGPQSIFRLETMALDFFLFYDLSYRFSYLRFTMESVFAGFEDFWCGKHGVCLVLPSFVRLANSW